MNSYIWFVFKLLKNINVTKVLLFLLCIDFWGLIFSEWFTLQYICISLTNKYRYVFNCNFFLYGVIRPIFCILEEVRK